MEPVVEPLGLVRLAEELKSGRRALLAYLDQAEKRFDAVEPRVHAFVPEPGRFERLRREATRLERNYPDPPARPPLFGVLVGVKDVFHVGGMPTSAGSRIPPAELAGPEAPSVAALRAAGALILGKTECTEFAYFAPGPTTNPRNPDHTPGGSSSGSAAAVAAALCPVALGTQTIGSISRPAAFCGVVGFKPSYDRIGRDGVIPLAEGLDHVGLLVTDVAGAELVGGLLARDWRPAPAIARPVLGVPEGPYLERAGAAGRLHFDEVCRRLGEAGYEIRLVEALGDFDVVVERHGKVLAAQAARTHAVWFGRHSDLYHPRTVELILRGQKIGAGELERALAGRRELREELTRSMDEHGLDLWIAPPAPGPAPRGLASTGDPCMNLPWTHAGLPTLCLPAGTQAEGLPMGLQVAARWYADESLMAWGRGMEEVLA